MFSSGFIRASSYFFKQLRTSDGVNFVGSKSKPMSLVMLKCSVELRGICELGDDCLWFLSLEWPL